MEGIRTAWLGHSDRRKYNTAASPTTPNLSTNHTTSSQQHQTQHRQPLPVTLHSVLPAWSGYRYLSACHSDVTVTVLITAITLSLLPHFSLALSAARVHAHSVPASFDIDLQLLRHACVIALLFWPTPHIDVVLLFLPPCRPQRCKPTNRTRSTPLLSAYRPPRKRLPVYCKPCHPTTHHNQPHPLSIAHPPFPPSPPPPSSLNSPLLHSPSLCRRTLDCRYRRPRKARRIRRSPNSTLTSSHPSHPPTTASRRPSSNATTTGRTACPRHRSATAHGWV